MKRTSRLCSVVIMCAAVIVLVAGARTGSLVLAQNPQPQPPRKPGLPNLKPLALVNVALDGVAKPIGRAPTGTAFPTPEFFVPRIIPQSGDEKILEIKTRDGRGSVRFSLGLPAGVSQGALQFIQESVPAPNAVGRLRYSGCVSCPASFTITVRAEDLSGSVSGQVKLNLTPSTLLKSLTLNKTSVISGASDSQVTGTVTLESNAPPDGIEVLLFTDQLGDAPKVVIVPRSVRVQENSPSVSFQITTKPVQIRRVVTIAAHLHGARKTATLTVEPPE